MSLRPTKETLKASLHQNDTATLQNRQKRISFENGYKTYFSEVKLFLLSPWSEHGFRCQNFKHYFKIDVSKL